MSRVQPYPSRYPFNTPDYQGGPIVSVGNQYFVGSTQANAQDVATAGQSPEFPFATLDYAIGRCTARNGDIIYCMPGHAETTSAIALDVAGVSVQGLGVGASKPTLTASTAATDLLGMSAASTAIRGMRLVGAASGVTAMINVAADDVVIGGVDPRAANEILTGAAPVDIITIASGDRGQILNNTFIGTAAGPDNVIMVESRTLDWVIKGNLFNYLEFDLDENVIDAPANSIPGWVITDNHMLGLAVAALTIKSSVANKFAFMDKCTLVAHAAAATIANLIGTTIEGMMFGGEVYATDTTKTERAVRVPTTTPA